MGNTMCRLYLITIIFFGYHILYGQTYFNNRYTFDSTYWNLGGNVIKTDSFYIIGGDALAKQDTFRKLAFLAIDFTGNDIWKKLIGEIGYDYYMGIGGMANINDNNFLISCTKVDSNNKYIAILIKLDNDANLLWSKEFIQGSNQGYIFNQFKQTSDSGFIVIGASDANDPDGDILLLKTDKNGNLQWEKTYGGGGVEYGFNIIITKEGDYLLSGYTNSFGAGDYDAYVIKTDNMGNVKWNKTYGAPKIDGGFNFVETSGGYYVGCGGKLDTILLEGTWDLIQNWSSIIKIDTDGNFIWQKKYGPSRYGTGLISIHELSDGNLVAAGQSNNNKGTPNGNGWPIGVILKVNSEGDSIWYREFEYDTCDKNFDYVRDMKPTNDGGFIVAGFFTPRTFDPCNDTGTQDMWVIKLDSCGCAYLGCDSACQGLTGVEEFQISDFRFNIYPNPFRESTTINFYLSEEDNVTISIYDLIGQKVKSIRCIKNGFNQIQISAAEIGEGVYFCRLVLEGKKVVINKLVALR